MFRSIARQTVAALLVALLAFSSGCGDDSTETNGADPGTSGGGDTLRIAVIPKGTSHQFWKSVHAGAQNAAEELGNVEIVWKGPAQENDTVGQIEVMRNLITQRVDGICLAPNHSEALVDAVVEADDEGIPVVIFDSGLGEGAEIVSYVATDNREGGRLAGHRLAEVLDEEGDVILLRYRAGSESTEQREEGFLEAIAQYPDIRVLSSDQYGEATTRQAMEKGSQLLLRYQDEVDGVFAVCEPNCNGMLEALEQAGMAGQIKFVGFDPSDSLIQGMREGKVDGIVLQDPVHMGYTAVKTMVQHLRGDLEDAPAYISTGEYLATPENMSDDQMRKLLEPELFED